MEIPPFIVMDVLETATKMERQGLDVVHLEVGEPDFETPSCIVEAGIRAMREGRTHYLFLALAALLEPGDEVILSNPHYACYPHFVRFLQGKPVFVNVEESDGFQYRPERIEKVLSARTKSILINSPSNPTGNLLDAARIQDITTLGPMIVSDEIYHGLVYEGREHSVLEYTDHAIVLNGFSKLYAMTGWRLGYLILPPEFVRPIQKIHQNFFISANDFVQWAGIAALAQADEDVTRMRRTYDERRRFMLRRLREIGFGISVEPTGAFYVLANARHFSQDSYELAFNILEQAHVGVAPGIDFGSHAEGYLRFSYAASLERIQEGMDRLDRYIRERFG
jgi:aspartate/methionine/tyrosine aminotransferase